MEDRRYTTELDSKYDDSMYPLAAHKDTANV